MPDFLHDYHHEKFYIFSEDIFLLLNEIGIQNSKSFEVKIDESKRINLGFDKKYFVLDPGKIRGAEIDNAKSGRTKFKICRECKTKRWDVKEFVKNYKNGIKKGLVVDESTWNKLPLFSINSTLYCTDDFIQLVKERKINNFIFQETETLKKTKGYMDKK